MTRFRAVVRRDAKNTEHFLLTLVDRQLEAAQISPPETLEIVEGDGGAFLLRLDSSGDCLADTWHETIAAAKAQAKFEYEIGDDQWQQVPMASR